MFNNDIYLVGEVGTDITLKKVIDLIELSDKQQPLDVYIYSGGGSVYEGISIYQLLKGLNQKVNTISGGLVASIASVIFLAGQKETRKINRIDNFLIHLPMGGVQGNAEDFEKTAKELRRIENKIADIYVNETDITKEEALDLMKADEMLDVTFLKEKGFVNEIIEFKAVATLINNKTNKMNEQLTKKDAEGLFSKFEKTLKNIFGKGMTNKLVQDANGVEIDFTDVAEDGSPAVGDKAQVDGKPADGSYVMPSGETFVFSAGELTEVVASEEEEAPAPDTSLEDAQAQIEALQKENDSLKAEAVVMTNGIATITNDFTELKNSITSTFEVEKKEKKEKGSNSRTFRKK